MDHSSGVWGSGGLGVGRVGEGGGPYPWGGVGGLGTGTYILDATVHRHGATSPQSHKCLLSTTEM